MTPTLTQADLGSWLDKEARRMASFAHEVEHFVHVYRKESASQLYPRDLVYRMKLPAWETILVYTYSVDVLADGAHHRHLSIQFSVPGEVTQGEVNAYKRKLLELVSPMVRLFFPMHDEVESRLFVSAPVPVVDSRDGRRGGNLHFRTPTHLHFSVPWDGPKAEVVAGAARVAELDPAIVAMIEAREAEVVEACAKFVEDGLFSATANALREGRWRAFDTGSAPAPEPDILEAVVPPSAEPEGCRPADDDTNEEHRF